MRALLVSHSAAAALIALTSLSLAACNARPSAVVAAPNAPGVSAPQVAAPVQVVSTAERADPRQANVPMINGRPMWSANRRNTAEENAAAQFERNGAAFGATSQADYVAKVHAFISAPPAGVQVIERPNGDRLLYDPAANVFAVVARNGAPRTMFKPREGASYWTQQQQRAAAQTAAAASKGDEEAG